MYEVNRDEEAKQIFQSILAKLKSVDWEFVSKERFRALTLYWLGSVQRTLDEDKDALHSFIHATDVFKSLGQQSDVIECQFQTAIQSMILGYHTAAEQNFASTLDFYCEESDALEVETVVMAVKQYYILHLLVKTNSVDLVECLKKCLEVAWRASKSHVV